uniref:Uncharacterized protein n=1 Tax=Chryseobacterium endophyticum TaxID=1854762 RepID=A0AAU6WUD8_9FLAO
MECENERIFLEKETFIISHGKNFDEDFIVSQIGYKILFYSYKNREKDENGYEKRKSMVYPPITWQIAAINFTLINLMV